MSLFLHKHWKKAVLALTAAFWASCDSDAVSANSSDSDEKTEISSSSKSKDESSNSAETPATKPAKVSSSSEEAKSSSSAKWHRRSSSSRFIPVHPIDEDSLGLVRPLYGVVDTIIETPIAMYGPPCYFSGTCDEEGQDTLTPIKDSIGDAVALYGVYMPDSLLSEKVDLDPSEKSRKDLKGRRQ